MAHQRQIIRDYVIAQLIVANTAAGARVTNSRRDDYRKGDLPAISVYTDEETVDQEQSNTAPREYTRDLTMDIVGWVFPGDNVDNGLDDLAVQIEAMMDGDRYLGTIPPLADTARAANTTLQSTKRAIRNEGDTPVGVIKLSYLVTYRWFAPQAPTLADDFLTADTKYPLAGSTPDTEIPEDNFNVRPTP
jgi:hypothetical protein